jgi:hypothetical protein
MNKAEKFVKTLVEEKLDVVGAVNRIVEKTNPLNKASIKMPPEYIAALKKFFPQLKG